MIFFHKCVFVDILLLIVKISYAEAKYEISSIDLPYQHNYGCGERVLVNQSSGVISYSIVNPVINLCWFITAKSQSNIAVSFSYFNLHSDDIYYPYNSILRDECSTYIVVSDASTKLNLHKKLPSKRICGSSLFHKVPTIFMKTDRVLVHLVKQDYQDVSQQMGFSLYYSIFKKCATQLDIERFTFLTSLNLPRMNPPIPCSWNITSTHNLPLRVVVNSVKLLFNSRLLIYDGADSNSPLLAVWIASFNGEFVTSTSDK
uniref:CUB domain-containing protein n=1 Tax=Ciona savignyi TaxID=51511 RepID=H2ZAJ0_CIOSA